MDNELLKLRIETIEEIQKEQATLFAQFAKKQTEAFIMLKKALRLIGVRLNHLEGENVTEQDLFDIDFDTFNSLFRLHEEDDDD